jgi:hypothetical protein
MARKRVNEAVAEDVIATPAAFRRRIHQAGDVTYGIAVYRKQIAPAAVQQIVAMLMSNPVYRTRVVGDAFPKDYSRIKARLRFGEAPREIEMLWAASVLGHYAKELTRYVELRDIYTARLLASDFESAIDVLQDIEARFGHSFWSTNARITLEQVHKGDAAKKILLNKIVTTKGINPVLAYVAYFYSYSLEENVSYADVKREFASAASNMDFYLRYQVLPFELDQIAEPHVIVNHEDNSPIIDRFEIFIEMAQLLVARGEALSELEPALRAIAAIPDGRIHNLLFCLGADGANRLADDNFIPACDKYTSGDYADAKAILADGSEDFTPRAWRFELYARISTAQKSETDGDTLTARIVREIGALLNLSKDMSECKSALRRFCFLMRKLQPCRAISTIIDRVVDLPVEKNFSVDQIMWCLSSPLNQPYHYAVLRQFNRSIFDRVLASSPQQTSVTHLLHSSCVDDQGAHEIEIAALAIPAKRKNLYLAYSQYNCGSYLEAVDTYRSYSSDKSWPTSPRTLTFHYALLRQLNQIKPALAALTDAYFENQHSHALYSLDALASWAVVEAEADDAALDRAILLHVYSTYYGSEHDGDMSDAFEDVLEHWGVNHPSELISLGLERQRLIYFLRFVATIDRLEDTTTFDDLDAIETERITILQWLVQNDPVNRNAYTQEISSITKDQEVARLSVRIERGKIYVHEEGVRRTFDTEVRPAFHRYRQLLSDPVSGAKLDEIEQRIRKLLKENDLEFGYLVLPSTERDSSYFAMIQRAYDIFVLDPNHGFKTYLSTRILHGVLEGELRSSFTSEHLLVSIDADDPEKDFLEVWEGRLGHPEESHQQKIASEVVRFSQRITQAIAKLKDARIRVYAQDTPEGLFAISMTDVAFKRLKSSVTPTTTYEEFYDRLSASFWDSTDACLRDVKLEINGNFRKQIASAFDALENALNGIEVGYRPSELLDALIRCRTSFATDLERISTWFSRAGSLSREPFSISTAIQVASRITNNCYPKYPLAIVLPEEMKVTVAGEILNPLVDLLTNCLQNAAQHSGVGDRAPEVEISIERSNDRGVNFEVCSELSPSKDIDACNREITNLLVSDDSANARAVAREGKTGILKMRRIIKHDFQSNAPLAMVIDRSRSVVGVRFHLPARYIDESRPH